MRIDGRTLSHETSETLRRLAVKRVQEGERPSAVMASLRLCRTTICKWLAAGAHPGPDTKLTPEQKLKVRGWVNGRDPRQYGFDFGRWTRQIVADLIEEKFGIALSATAVGRLLAELDINPRGPCAGRWGATQRPSPVGQRRCSRRSKNAPNAAGRRSFSSMRPACVPTRCSGVPGGLRGKTPEVATSGKRQGINAICALTAQGGFWYALYAQRLNAARFLDLLRAFMRGRTGRVVLVLDGHGRIRRKSSKTMCKA